MKKLYSLYKISGVSEFEIYLKSIIDLNILNVTNMSELYKLYNIEDTEKYNFQFLCNIQYGKIIIIIVCDMYLYHDHYDCFKNKEIIEEFDITKEMENKIIKIIESNYNLKEFLISKISYSTSKNKLNKCLQCTL